ncbi:hypothetical protein GWO43_05900 [candidate division KSB1 bacterium]|nr:hypothetical protein [candidate division KSB1 bacterium]NIU08399.1 hypothetical protein [Phycisphaerae bacterium]NIW11066.1 hypothetical protein [Gammaproteobacteria bacterium]NIR71938.1 hypothetical protein [candidate division KSB1 bacterium]NIT70421.1 hypothetical protein [candidate division KSB1 bacterium]
MKILYDEKYDILDVFFNETNHDSVTASYELRDGIVLYVSENMVPRQLKVVNYRRLTEFPMIHFNRFAKLPETIREQLSALLTSPPLSAFIRIDSETNYGYLINQPILEACHREF